MDSKKKDEEVVEEPHQRWSLFRFIEELKRELMKVSWTSRKELRQSTKIVILSTFVFGFGIYVADLAIKGVLTTVGMVFRWVFG